MRLAPLALLTALALLLAGCTDAAREASGATAPADVATEAAPALAATGVITEAAAPAPSPAVPTVVAASAAPKPGTRNANGRLVVALDAGHGGDESGAAANGVVERDSNLDMAQRVARYLDAGGVDALLTREDAGRAVGAHLESGSVSRADLQARTRRANAAGAAAFVSIHSNGSPDPSMRGVEVYYESRRPFAEDNLRLARMLLDGTLQSLSAAGYSSNNRGVIDAACWRNRNGRCFGLFVLSPAGTTTAPTGAGTATAVAKEATEMPAVLVELLFISNAQDAAMLNTEAVRDAMARGLSDAILRYLGER